MGILQEYFFFLFTGNDNSMMSGVKIKIENESIYVHVTSKTRLLENSY